MTKLRPFTLAAGMQEKFSGCIPISLISTAVFCVSAKNFQRPHNEGNYPQRFQLKPKKQKLHYSSVEKKDLKLFKSAILRNDSYLLIYHQTKCKPT